MRKERRNLSGDFKAKIALEALTERKTIAQLAEENGIQTSQVSAWKRQLLEQSAKIFEPAIAVKNPEEEKKKDELYMQIGQLKVENDYLKKKSAQLFR